MKKETLNAIREIFGIPEGEPVEIVSPDGMWLYNDDGTGQPIGVRQIAETLAEAIREAKSE